MNDVTKSDLICVFHEENHVRLTGGVGYTENKTQLYKVLGHFK
jgi:hypothetical protein